MPLAIQCPRCGSVAKLGSGPVDDEGRLDAARFEAPDGFRKVDAGGSVPAVNLFCVECSVAAEVVHLH